VPLLVEPVQGSAPAGNLRGNGMSSLLLIGKRVFSSTGLSVWTRQLAGLVSSGLPLERALTALTEEAEDDALRDLVAGLRAEVNAGSSFARALAMHPREFSEIYVAVISAGEQSGNLGLVLERLADDLEERQLLKAKLAGAMLYPAIVTLIAIVIVLFLVGYVVPQVANVFAGTKRSLPFLTTVMLGLSDGVRNYGWLMLLTLVSAGTGLHFGLRNEVFRLAFDTVHQPRRPAEPTDTDGQGLSYGRFGPTGIGIDRLHPGLGQRAGHASGLGGSAQKQDAGHG
jgi:general secretion pathway protein F